MENTEIITKAIDYAKRCCCLPDISVGEIAENTGFSLDYFSRIFLAHTGFTVSGYINYQRLKKAAILLRTTDRTVLDIALEVGYESHEGFLKAFKKRYGMPPSNYRNENKSKSFTLADVSDETVVSRFLYENPDLKPLPDSAWDDLLERDFKRYVYLYEVSVAQGQRLATPDGDNNKAFINAGDLGGKPFVQVLCDIPELAAKLMKRFPGAELVTSIEPEKLSEVLRAEHITLAGIRVISRYCGERPTVKLPEGMSVRRLCADDIPAIQKVKYALPKGYAMHLLDPVGYSDPDVLEYGVFVGEELILIAGCGLSSAFGTVINDSIRFYLTAEKPDNNVFRHVFAAIVADIMDMNAVPYDDIQHGEYAKENGGFTAVEVGFEPVCYGYTCVKTE